MQSKLKLATAGVSLAAVMGIAQAGPAQDLLGSTSHDAMSNAQMAAITGESRPTNENTNRNSNTNSNTTNVNSGNSTGAGVDINALVNDLLGGLAGLLTP